MMKSIKRFMMQKGFYRNDQKLTIVEMIDYVNQWQEELKQPRTFIKSIELLNSLLQIHQSPTLTRDKTEYDKTMIEIREFLKEHEID